MTQIDEDIPEDHEIDELWEEQRAGVDEDEDEERGAAEGEDGAKEQGEEAEPDPLFSYYDCLHAAREKICGLLGKEVVIKKGRGENILLTFMEESKPEGIEEREQQNMGIHGIDLHHSSNDLVFSALLLHLMSDNWHPKVKKFNEEIKVFNDDEKTGKRYKPFSE